MAQDMCAAIGAHLITNEEWMTIVRNVEDKNANWSGGQVAQGHLNTSSSSFILSNNQSVFYLVNKYTEHINSYIVPSEGQWPTLISDPDCNNDSYYIGWRNDCINYKYSASSYHYYPYNAIGNWGALNPNKFLPGYYTSVTSATTSRNAGYGTITLKKNAPFGQYCLVRNGSFADDVIKGLLQLQFESCSDDYYAAFRCVKNTTTP